MKAVPGCYTGLMSRLGPFPGIDPWLQLFWSTVQTSLCTYMSEALNDAHNDIQAATE